MTPLTNSQSPEQSALAASRARSPLARPYRAGVSDRFRPRLRHFVACCGDPRKRRDAVGASPQPQELGRVPGVSGLSRQQSPLFLIPHFFIGVSLWRTHRAAPGVVRRGSADEPCFRDTD